MLKTSSRPNHPKKATMDTKSCWPDDKDQTLIRQLLTEFGEQGYGLCYRLGAYRAQGLSHAEAAQRLRADLGDAKE
jgi:hypothetical protein